MAIFRSQFISDESPEKIFQVETLKLRKYASSINKLLGFKTGPIVMLTDELVSAGLTTADLSGIFINPKAFWMIDASQNPGYVGFRDNLLNVYAHEMQHYLQIKEGRLNISSDGNFAYWRQMSGEDDPVVYKFSGITQTEYRNFPWEIEANSVSCKVVEEVLNAEKEVSKEVESAGWLSIRSLRSSPNWFRKETSC